MAEEKEIKNLKLTSKQKLFCDEYIICQNATEAAIKAGYSQKTAGTQGYENMQKPHIRAYIDARMAEHESKLIATQAEVLKHLTAVLRGESVSEEIVVEGCGDGYSEARAIDKRPSEKDRLLAADKLLKCYGAYTDREKMKLDRERFELDKEKFALEKERQSAFGFDADDGQHGVIMLAPVLTTTEPEEDNEGDEDDES